MRKETWAKAYLGFIGVASLLLIFVTAFSLTSDFPDLNDDGNNAPITGAVVGVENSNNFSFLPLLVIILAFIFVFGRKKKMPELTHKLR